jgi:hypothetical protein
VRPSVRDEDGFVLAHAGTSSCKSLEDAALVNDEKIDAAALTTCGLRENER